MLVSVMPISLWVLSSDCAMMKNHGPSGLP